MSQRCVAYTMSDCSESILWKLWMSKTLHMFFELALLTFGFLIRHKADHSAWSMFSPSLQWSGVISRQQAHDAHDSVLQAQQLRLCLCVLIGDRRDSYWHPQPRNDSMCVAKPPQHSRFDGGARLLPQSNRTTQKSPKALAACPYNTWLLIRFARIQGCGPQSG